MVVVVVVVVFLEEYAVEQTRTVWLPVTWDVMTLKLRHCYVVLYLVIYRSSCVKYNDIVEFLCVA